MSIPSSATSYLHADIVLVRAVTPVHAGIGRAGEFVDLPVQRDEFGYPCIYSSSFKGALKTALLTAELSKNAVNALLGPDPDEGETFESSVAVLDAYLLAMPVRSLVGVYAYITSPHLLRVFIERCSLYEAFREDGKAAKLCGELKGELENLKLGYDKALCVGACETIKVGELKDRALLAEEYLLTIEEAKTKNIAELADIAGLKKPLLIIDDDVAKGLLERGIIRQARVRLERGKKTVVTGALWNEEYLPRGTVLHTMFLYKKTKCKTQSPAEPDDVESYIKCLKDLGLIGKDFKQESIYDIVKEVATTLKKNIIGDKLKNYVVLGGHETIGKGIVRLVFLEGEG